MTKNPGFYTGPIDCDDHYTRALCGPTPPKFLPPDWAVFHLMLTISVTLVVVTVLLFVAYDHMKKKREWLGLVGVILIFVVTGGSGATVASASPTHLYRHSQSLFGIAGGGLDTRATNFDKYEAAQTLPGYEKRVQTWLTDDYGISVNLNAVNMLRHGKEVAVTYAGKPIGIQFMTAGNGGLAIRETGGTVIAPLAK